MRAADDILRRFGTGEITEGDADAQIFQLRYGPPRTRGRRSRPSPTSR
jgi:hypothetical protein